MVSLHAPVFGLLTGWINLDSGGRGEFVGIAHAEEKMRQSLVLQSTTALPECLGLARLLVSPIREDCGTDTQPRLCHVTLSVMGCSCGVGGYNETASRLAIYNCTMRASVTVPASGLSNPQ